MRRPVLPGGRKLPWILGVASLTVLAYGLLSEDRPLALIGGIGAAATFVGFVLPRFILPPGAAEHEEQQDLNDER